MHCITFPPGEIQKLERIKDNSGIWPVSYISTKIILILILIPTKRFYYSFFCTKLASYSPSLAPILGIFPKKIKYSSEIAFSLKYTNIFFYFISFVSVIFLYHFRFKMKICFSAESVPRYSFLHLKTEQYSHLFSIMLTYAHLCSEIFF